MAKDSKKDAAPGLVQIVYVGRKPHAHDNVARSGKQWAGFGDVQEVTQQQASTLLKYPDQWAVFDPKNPPTRESAFETQLQRLNEVHEQAKNNPSGRSLAATRIEDMDEEQLVEHARHHYGIDLNPRASIEELRAAIDDAVAAAAQEAEKLRNGDMLGGEGQ